MRSLILQFALLWFLCFCISGAFGDRNVLAPEISPSENPEPFLPLLGPSPMMPIIPSTNNSMPELSGHCTLNFSSVESLMRITATDCWNSFAPYSANVICCPQFEATLVTLLGHSSKTSGILALNSTHSKQCLSDIEKILTSEGANRGLQKICSIREENLTKASCPIVSTEAFESIVNSSKIVSACKRIDIVNECCDQVCQNAITEAAQKLALNGSSSLDETRFSPQHLKRIEDCKEIVLRWLASKLDPHSANAVLRGLSNCKINEVCPLVFPNMSNVSRECGNVIRNQKVCCEAVDDYVSMLQEQSFITNVQALNCAASLGNELQKLNVSKNIYDLCRISIKDFSLQVGSQESGCLLPSSPSDATFDETSGISFICDLNDNIAAPWPSSSFKPVSLCNKTTKIPALPKATSAGTGFYTRNLELTLFFLSMAFMKLFL